MNYKIYLILFITFWLSDQTAFAVDQRYRVELLVLRHLQGVSELSPQTTLRDFSTALDLLAPPAAAEEPATVDELTVDPAEAEQIPTEEAIEATDQEPQIVLLETQSDVMQRAWQRLRSSSAYRPELYMSWQQADAELAPLIRLHDQEVLVEEDPYADLRLNPENNGEDDGESDDAAVALPEPIRFYRIDGTASLRKTRFLHLDLDIEYREPLSGDNAQGQPDPAVNLQEGERPRPSVFLVHTLQQTRQVQTQEMEYFDGPVFAVLAMISRVEMVTTQDIAVDPTAE